MQNVPICTITTKAVSRGPWATAEDLQEDDLQPDGVQQGQHHPAICPFNPAVQAGHLMCPRSWQGPGTSELPPMPRPGAGGA